MKGHGIGFALSICLALTAGGVVYAAAGSPDDLKGVLGEPNLVKRARLALDFGDRAASQAGQACRNGEYEDCNKLLEQVGDSVDLAGKSLDQTGMDPARKPQSFKEAELHTRKIMRALEAVRAYVRPEEIDHVNAVYRRISEIDDRLVSGIMGRKRKK